MTCNVFTSIESTTKKLGLIETRLLDSNERVLDSNNNKWDSLSAGQQSESAGQQIYWQQWHCWAAMKLLSAGQRTFKATRLLDIFFNINSTSKAAGNFSNSCAVSIGHVATARKNRFHHFAPTISGPVISSATPAQNLRRNRLHSQWHQQRLRLHHSLQAQLECHFHQEKLHGRACELCGPESHSWPSRTSHRWAGPKQPEIMAHESEVKKIVSWFPEHSA